MTDHAGKPGAGGAATIDDHRAFFEALIAYIPEGITVAAAPDTTIVAVSDHGRLITGRAESDLIGKSAKHHPEQWQIYHLDGKTLAAPDALPLTRATEQGEVVENEEWLLKRSDGTFAHVLCNAGPVSVPGGERRWGIIAWREISDLRDAQRDLAQAQLKAIRHKDAVHQELQHRVKNHMSMIQSALRLQACAVDNVEAEAALIGAAERVGSVASIYDGLEDDTGEHIAVKPYLGRVIDNLTHILQGGDVVVTVTLDCDDIILSAEDAMNVAMIVTELLTNARKHAVGPSGACLIAVSAKRGGDDVTLIVSDKGGLDDVACLKAGTGLGLKIAETVAHKLGGELEYTANGGLSASVTFAAPNG